MHMLHWRLHRNSSSRKSNAETKPDALGFEFPSEVLALSWPRVWKNVSRSCSPGKHINRPTVFTNSSFLTMQIRHCFAAGALLLLSALHGYASPTSGVGDVHSLPSVFTTLHPGLHPDEDTADLDNLKGKFNSSLYYKAKPDSPVQGAGLMQLKHKYPTVSLERSRFISSVTCEPTSDSMVVTFNDSKSFGTAVMDWSTHKSGFILISYVPGCGEGTDSSERSFHFVSNFVVSEKDRCITCHIVATPLQDTLDNSSNILLHVATYGLDDPDGPSPRNVSQTPVPSPGAVVAPHHSKRGWFDKVTQAVKTAANAVANTAVTAANAVVGVVKTPISARPTVSAQIGTQTIVPWNSTYRDQPAYLLYHTESGRKSLDLTCPRCGAQITIYFKGTFEGNIVDGFTQANMAIEMDLDITLALGIHANSRYEANKDFLTINGFVPGANIVVPGLVEVGPAVGLTVGAGYSLELDGFFSAGFTCSWKKVGGRVDFLNSRNSQSMGEWGVQTVCKRILDAEVTASVSIQLYTKLALKLRVAVLPKFSTKLSAEAALVEKLSLVLTTSVSTNAGTCAPFVPYLTGSIESLLYIAATGLSDFPLHTPLTYQLFGSCLTPKRIAASDNDSTPGKTPSFLSFMADAKSNFAQVLKTAALTQQKAASAFELGSPAGLVDFNDMVLDFTPSGNTMVRQMDPSYNYDTWRVLDKIVFASSNGGTLFCNPSLVLPEGDVIGRLTIANPDTAPAGRNELFVGQPPDSTYAILVDDVKHLTFYTIICTFADNRREVFLTTVSDPIKAAASVKNQPGITGAGVTACAISYFEIYA
ncbi:hypothetical protein C8R44DRAFT_981442 [Mycena epipterygia]|nr:hypothetical protein C8R44DRAFT_981442 [Mycena epipterygia]